MVKTAIYYFSSTGNSLAVARDLARGLDNADIIPINSSLDAPDASFYERVGFVFPIYMFGLPLIVRSFLGKIEIKPETYVFSVATFGGLPGRALSMAGEILKKRGIELACGFSVQMPGNYTPLYGAIPRKQQDKIFLRQKIKTQKIIALVCQQAAGVMEENPFLLNLALYLLFYRAGSSRIPLSARRGFWSTEACTKCGLCAKICPVGNIQLQGGRPFWLLHCQHCMGCLQWCPAQAIEYRNFTRGKGRYHHPEIQALDLITRP
ncbi:MAG: EFR1 family ferrodoxin [Candidatus Omnitrophica bacterium]|nr:EFR1 family ferrodoxin [Candidatus Omnitrophota bacterium]